MIVEQRTYKIRNGQMAKYLQLIKEQGISIQQPILGQLIGYFTTDIGTLSQIVHIWAYDSLDDRAVRRAKLASDSAWKDFLPKISELIESAENKILIPTEFSPLK